jgi:hypothetical protein
MTGRREAINGDGYCRGLWYSVTASLPAFSSNLPATSTVGRTQWGWC